MSSLVRYKNLIIDPDGIKCVELADVRNHRTPDAKSGRQDIVVHFRSHSLKPRLKDATQADLDAVWNAISGPRGVDRSEPKAAAPVAEVPEEAIA